MDTPKKIGRYEILEELGHGAMGTVYRAKDPAMDRVVAVKTIISLVLANDQKNDFRERFYREARAAGSSGHPRDCSRIRRRRTRRLALSGDGVYQRQDAGRYHEKRRADDARPRLRDRAKGR